MAYGMKASSCDPLNHRDINIYISMLKQPLWRTAIGSRLPRDVIGDGTVLIVRRAYKQSFSDGTPKTPPCRRVIRAKHPGFRCQNYILEEEISAASSLAEKTQPLDVCRKKMEKLAVYSEARVECSEARVECKELKL